MSPNGAYGRALDKLEAFCMYGSYAPPRCGGTSSPKPAIDGTFMTLADGLVEAMGMFHVELQP